MRFLTEWLQNATGIPAELFGKLFTSLACIIVFWFFRWLILKRVWRRTENSRTRYEWRKISNYLMTDGSGDKVDTLYNPEFTKMTSIIASAASTVTIITMVFIAPPQKFCRFPGSILATTPFL